MNCLGSEVCLGSKCPNCRDDEEACYCEELSRQGKIGMTPDEKSKIEAVVNSQEAVDLVEENFEAGWDKLVALFAQKLDRRTTDYEKSRLYADLRDWWKNGNFRVWVEGEVDELNFGVGKWELGDPDFWGE